MVGEKLLGSCENEKAYLKMKWLKSWELQELL